ncbi:MAG: hypothetical protein JJE39_11245 [Vicinamibacteria bacterium]|nr:hypothetical protein [Vicinamibacteria bacterium]
MNDPILGVDLAEWQAKVAQWWRAFSRTFAVAFSNPKQLVMVQLEKQAKEESKKSLSPQSTQQQGEEGANKVLSQLAKQPEREGEYISPFLFVPSACAVGSLILRAAEGTMGVDQPFLPGPDYKARLDAFSGFLAFLASVAPGPVDPLTILSALP